MQSKIEKGSAFHAQMLTTEWKQPKAQTKQTVPFYCIGQNEKAKNLSPHQSHLN
jgi:hypothetical protein